MDADDAMNCANPMSANPGGQPPATPPGVPLKPLTVVALMGVPASPPGAVVLTVLDVEVGAKAVTPLLRPPTGVVVVPAAVPLIALVDVLKTLAVGVALVPGVPQ